LNVSGGSEYSQRLSSAEIFDPINGTWSSIDDLTRGRDWHTATVLPGGHVLVAGVGNVDEAAATSLDRLDRTNALLDPATGHWRDAGVLIAGRGYHTATLLPSGEVLIAGGFDLPGGAHMGNMIDSAELYDPRRAISTFTSRLNFPRSGHTATLLPNGKVLVVGGTRGIDRGMNTGVVTELYERGGSGATISAGHTGSWFDPTQSGHGIALEVLRGDPLQLLASWFMFAPHGGHAWIVGLGPIAGNSAVVPATQSVGIGGRFPPNFNAANVRQEDWGTLTFTFRDCDHGRVDWMSVVPGYGSGGMDLTRLTLPAGLTCSP
jgi:hypothetical protein